MICTAVISRRETKDSFQRDGIATFMQNRVVRVTMRLYCREYIIIGMCTMPREQLLFKISTVYAPKLTRMCIWPRKMRRVMSTIYAL